jgi:cold shock CspA family protein
MTGRRSGTRLALMLVFAVSTAATACAATGLGDILVPGGSTLNGEVRSIDTRRNSISIRHDRGRDERVRYDNRTRLYSGGRQYPVSSLSRGDRVRMQVSQDRRGTVWADRIEVHSASRSSRSDRVHRVDGRVRTIDHRRGYFTIEHNRTTTAIHLSRHVSNADLRRFDRLRRGDRVRADVRGTGRGNSTELVRFR